MTDVAARAHEKRPRSESTADTVHVKRRKVCHRLQHAPRRLQHIEPAPQDPVFSQGQLLKSITVALTLAGFDAVQPTALEMFRSHTEEYMLKLLEYVKTSMQNNRRTKATPSDFSMALAQMPNAAQASLLKAQLSLAVPEAVAFPQISEPTSSEPRAPDLSALLAPLINDAQPKYIPRHFPLLPPRHAWQQTPVFPQRETDPRKMREKSTQEGAMAEQSLRKLAAAAASGALKAERRKTQALSGPGKLRNGFRRWPTETKEDAFAQAMMDIGVMDSMNGTELMDSSVGLEADGGMPDGVVVVNHEMDHWRRGAARTS